MRKITLITIAVFLTINCYSQVPSWSWARSTPEIGSACSLATDALSNVFVAGTFADSQITFGSNTFTNSLDGENNMFIAKYNSSGSVLWAASQKINYIGGGNGWTDQISVTTDAAGNAYVAGRSTDNQIVFGNDTITNNLIIGMFIVKYSPSGAVLWAKGSYPGVYPNSITADAAGNVYINGFVNYSTMIFGSDTLNSSFGNISFLAKYDANGNAVFAKKIASENLIGAHNTIACDNSGIYVTGNFNSPTLVLGSTTLINNCAYYNTYLVKYDSNGNILFAKNGGGSKTEYTNSIAADGAGNIYVAGTYDSVNAVFGITTLPYSGDKDMYIVKYNSGGALIWANSEGPCSANSVATDGAGNVYVNGGFNSAITFGTTTLPSSEDNYIVKLDANANVDWAMGFQLGLTPNGSIATDNFGSLYFSGSFTPSALTFGSTTLVNTHSQTDDGPVFVSKLNSTTGINETKDYEEIIIYPNPFTSATTVSFNGNEWHNIKITDVVGKEIKTIQHFRDRQVTIEKGEMKAGVYFVRIEDEKKNVVNKKIVVQ